jgi:hypothetical protein
MKATAKSTYSKLEKQEEKIEDKKKKLKMEEMDKRIRMIVRSELARAKGK